MKEILLLKMGEMVLKGLNKKSFEESLLRDIKRKIINYGIFSVLSRQSAIVISPKGESRIKDIAPIMSRIFGIASFSRACAVEKDMEKIKEASCDYLDSQLSICKTFKVEAKRSDKGFKFTSPKICEELGEYILDKYSHIKVDVHNPEITVTVEIRDFEAYIHGKSEKGAGGIPVGMGGNAAILISGGIDSPVAAWMMAKRGISLTAVHFASPPYTSERAEQKVVKLLKMVSLYCGDIKMYTVPFTSIQETIKKQCPEELFTIIMRRMMMKISQVIAEKESCLALITGESLGQVASQTIGAIACTDAVSSIPVFRPLIGMDKEEIISISRKIQTFDISIEPYEDCCTVFVPKHPRTKPRIQFVESAEKDIDWTPFINEAIENINITYISGDKSRP